MSEQIKIEKRVLSKLVSENTKYQEIIKKLYTQISELKAEHNQSIIPQHDYEFEIDQLTQENLNLNSIISKLSNQLSIDQSHYNSQIAQNNSFQANLTIQSLQHTHQQQINTLNTQIANLNSELNALKTTSQLLEFTPKSYQISDIFPQISFQIENLITKMTIHQQKINTSLVQVQEKIQPKLVRISSKLADLEPETRQINLAQITQLQLKNDILTNDLKKQELALSEQNDHQLHIFKLEQQVLALENKLQQQQKKKENSVLLIHNFKELTAKLQSENAELTQILNEKDEELGNVKTVFQVLQNELKTKIKQIDAGQELDSSEQMSILGSVEKLIGKSVGKRK